MSVYSEIPQYMVMKTAVSGYLTTYYLNYYLFMIWDELYALSLHECVNEENNEMFLAENIFSALIVE